MAIQVTMPRLSDTMERGTVVKWHVKEGDSVSPGDVLADIETDKATMELEAFDEGTVARLAVDEGQSVGVGETILMLAEEGEDPAEAAASAGSSAPAARAEGTSSDAPTETSSPSATAVAEAPVDSGAASTAPNGTHTQDRIFASPLARKIAREKGIDLSAVAGSGPGGRIVRKDVEQLAVAAPSAASQPSPATPVLPAAGPSLEHQVIPLSTMRETIARRLVESKQTIPHYQVSVDVQMDALLDLRRQLNEQLASQKVKLSVNDFLVRACALAMHDHPFVNSRWRQDANPPAIEILPDVNIGIAIALPMERGGGLVVATLRNADRMGLRMISSESKRLSTKAREKGLSVEEMADGTFTISNLGMFGVSHFTAIINPPQVAILAVGAAQQRPVVRDGQVVPGHVMTMTMSSDHRVIDGAMAAAYLASVRELLENPATLLV